MSDSKKSLKEQNSPAITAYLVANGLIFWVLVNSAVLDVSFNDIDIQELSIEIFAKPTLYSLVAFCLMKVLSNQFPKNWVEIIVFWHLKNPLPGSRAFSHFMFQDSRIDTQIIQSRFAPLPSDPVEQNKLWYKIYKKHSSAVSVNDAQKNYLLTREITGLSVIIALVFGIAGMLLLPLKMAAVYGIVLIFVYVLVSQASRNYAVDFVTNVLAEESVSSETSNDNGSNQQ